MTQEKEEGVAGEMKSEISEVQLEDLEVLKNALSEEKTKAEANLAGWQRAQADFINYRRRSEQEREENRKLANAGLILNLLPVLDDLERAFVSIPSEMINNDWINGVKLIERKLRASLEAQGLSEIKALGEPFDPNLHEAVMHLRGKEGIVVQEMQKGYKLHDRVIRPSKVAVGNGEEEKKEE